MTAQVQLGGSNNDELHVCHTSCDLLDAGTLSSWLSEVGTWIKANPNNVVTILLVNGADASASDLAAQYETAGLSSLSYTPSGSSSSSQSWPTLQTLITSGTPLVNFVASLDNSTDAPYLMNEFNYVFENNYDVSTPSNFTCTANRPSSDTTSLLSSGMMPLMNHFLYQVSGGSLFTIDSPNATYVPTTNGESGLGNLYTAATTCKQYYGRSPNFLLVDFSTVGPAIATVDRLNGVTNAVGREKVSTADSAPTSSGGRLTAGWILLGLLAPLASAFALL